MSRSVVAAMTAYTLELREADVKLNQNEAPFDFPRDLKEKAVARALERPWNIYPDFENAALRKAIASFVDLDAENILVGNGSNELLAATIATYVGPGTPVVFPRPTFALYEKLVSIAGGLPVAIEFDPDSGVLPLEEMLAAIQAHENAVVIVCSPNNPTGSVLPDGGLDALLGSGAMVLLDQAYADFDGESVVLRDKLVTFRTFSKAFGLAALRVGWLMSTASNCREIRKVKLPYSLNAISEMVAVIALENRGVRDRNVAATVAERARVMRAMAKLKGVTVFPTRANFVTFRAAPHPAFGQLGTAPGAASGGGPSPRVRGEGARSADEGRTLFAKLLDRGVLVRDVSSYPRLQNCLRVSIGSREQNDAFLAALEEAL